MIMNNEFSVLQFLSQSWGLNIGFLIQCTVTIYTKMIFFLII